MTDFGSAVRRRRQQLGLTLAALAQAAGCSKAYLSAIENERVDNPPSPPVIDHLERALSLEAGQLAHLANWQRTPPTVRAEVRRLEQANRRIVQILKRSMTARADGAANLDALYRSGDLNQLIENMEGNINLLPGVPVSVPLINKVAAGYPTEFTDLDYPANIADEYVTCPDLTDPSAFAARVVGDSMTPEYRAGDVIVFSPQTEPTDGADCFVRLMPDHHTTFKRIYFEDDHAVRLQPLNPSFAPQTVALQDVSGLYPAVYRMQKLNGTN